MRHVAWRAVAALFLVLLFFAPAQANRQNIRHCADDYRRFCHQWGLETRGLENCMRRHGDRLTNACIAALVRAGEVSQAEVNRRRAALGR
jgi:ribosomal protein L32E